MSGYNENATPLSLRLVAVTSSLFCRFTFSHLITNQAFKERFINRVDCLFNRHVSPPRRTVGSRMREALKVRRYLVYRSGERMPSPSFWSLG